MRSQSQNNLDLGFYENKYQDPSLEIINSVFNYYRRDRGFPFPSFSMLEKKLMFQELIDLKTQKLIDGLKIQSDSTSIWLANSYHPHRYDVQCRNMKTAMQVFKNDELLKRCIKKCIKMYGTISDKKLLTMLSIFEGVQVASNFPTGTAKAIYKYFLPSGGRVWDMSMGWGGRLLSAASLKNIYYIGTEPSSETFTGLSNMVKELGIVVNLIFSGSENITFEKNCFDLCFTSPPYYDTEKYAREYSQSFLKFPYRQDWINGFMGSTLLECHRALKPDGVLLINIANVETFKDLEKQTVKKAIECGFQLNHTMKIEFSIMPGSGKKNKNASNQGNRTEPLFVFTKA